MPKPIINILASNKYGDYCVPYASRHRPVAQYILQGQVWEPLTVALMCEQCGGGDVVVAGTYFGDFLPPLSAAMAAGNRIWAFEPHPENHACTEWTLHLNRLANVSLSDIGLSHEAGEMEFCLTNGGTELGGASYVVGNAGQLHDKERLTKIRVASLDSLIPPDRNISILQYDLEGHEQFALMGSLETIRRCRPIIILESLPEKDWFFQNIMSLGYDFYGKVHFNAVFSPRPIKLPIQDGGA